MDQSKTKLFLKFLKDNWIEILIYFILLGGFLALMITKGILEEKLLLLKNTPIINEVSIKRTEGYLKPIDTTITVFTALNLLFTPHKLYGTVRSPLKQKMISMHQNKKNKKNIIVER